MALSIVFFPGLGKFELRGGSFTPLQYEGGIGCDGREYPIGDRGDFYICTRAGGIGGAVGRTLAVNDVLLCLASTGAGPGHIVGDNWTVLENPIEIGTGGGGVGEDITEAQSWTTAEQAQARANLSLVPTSGKVIHVSKATTATDTRTGLSVYDPAKPFATLTAAKAAASSGDTEAVGPGTWDEKNVAKTGVALDFAMGSVLTYTGAARGSLFDDSLESGTDAAIVATIRGDKFYSLSNFATADNDEIAGVVTMQKAGSKISLHAVELGTLTAPATSNAALIVIDQRNGELDVTCDKILCGEGSGGAFYWWINGGRSHNRINSIEGIGMTGGGTLITTAVTAASLGDFYLEGCGRIVNDGGLAIQHQDEHASARAWFIGLGEVGGTTGAIDSNYATAVASRIYYKGQKVFSTAAGSNVIKLKSGHHWHDWQKLEAPAGAASGVTLTDNAIIRRMVLGEIDTLGACTNIVVVNGAGVEVRDLSIPYFKGHASAGGILVTAASLFRLRDSLLNTSANAGTVPLSVNGGQTVVLRDVHLQSGAASSISRANGSGTVTVICLGACTANVDVGANVTVVGTLLVNASFS